MKKFEDFNKEEKDSLIENAHIFNSEILNENLMPDERLYDCNVQQANIYILGTVLKLNNVKLEQFLGRGINNLPVDVHIEAFRNESILFNDKMEKLHFLCDSRDFRARFLSLTLIELAQKLEKCIDVMFAISTDTDTNKLNLLSGYINMILDFSINFLNLKDYGNLLEVICELLLVSKKDKKKRNHNAITAYSEHMSFFKQSYTNSIIEAKTLESILKSAFTMVTGCVPNDDDFCIETFSQYDQEDVRNAIKLLGGAILKKVRNGKRVCRAYKIFIKSKPYLFYKFNDINEDDFLNMGCRALSYLVLVANDNRLSKIVKRLCYA